MIKLYFLSNSSNNTILEFSLGGFVVCASVVLWAYFFAEKGVCEARNGPGKIKGQAAEQC